MSTRVAAAIVGVIARLFLIAIVVRTRRGRTGDGVVHASPALAKELRRDVEALCAFGPRNTFEPENLAAAPR